jgi:hypothetical protein
VKLALGCAAATAAAADIDYDGAPGLTPVCTVDLSGAHVAHVTGTGRLEWRVTVPHDAGAPALVHVGVYRPLIAGHGQGGLSLRHELGGDAPVRVSWWGRVMRRHVDAMRTCLDALGLVPDSMPDPSPDWADLEALVPGSEARADAWRRLHSSLAPWPYREAVGMPISASEAWTALLAARHYAADRFDSVAEALRPMLEAGQLIGVDVDAPEPDLATLGTSRSAMALVEDVLRRAKEG